MKKMILIIFVVLLLPLQGQGQIKVPNTMKPEVREQVPQERVFLHYNSSLLLPGEYLYYKMYLVDGKSGKLSKFSKIGYVELIDENGQVIFRHKLKLNGGLGQGDFFVPASVRSGNYKLLGFTQWMKNGPEMNFFRSDIVLINPYSSDQENLMAGANTSEVAQEEQSADLQQKNSAEKINENRGGEILEIFTDYEEYHKRQPVSLDLRYLKKGMANVSVSVRKIDALPAPEPYSSSNYEELYGGWRNFASKDSLYLPELRGELFTGQLTAAKAVPVHNRQVALSIPEENPVLKISRTDEHGFFYFNLDENYIGQNALLQVLGNERGDYGISVKKRPEVDHSKIRFGHFSIDPSMKETIEKRSVYDQIENAYFEVKADSLRPIEEGSPFYVKSPEVYILDEYKRFPTLKETFVEIINSAWISNNEQGEPVFRIRGLQKAMDLNLETLLLVDGIMIQDHKDFIDYPAAKVESIRVLRNKFFLGPHIFKGIIDIRTKNNDFSNTYSPGYLRKFELEKAQSEKIYFQPEYSGDRKDPHIPDFRYQLLWLPQRRITSNAAEVDFFTSDVTGDFEISVEGFTDSGEPVSCKKMIRVVE